MPSAWSKIRATASPSAVAPAETMDRNVHGATALGESEETRPPSAAANGTSIPHSVNDEPSGGPTLIQRFKKVS